MMKYREVLYRPLLLLLLSVFAQFILASTAHAGAVASLGSIGNADTQVTPNTFGEYRTAAEDMRVKVLGGYIRITRDWVDGAWSLNKRWSPINTSADAQYKDEPYQHCWSSYTDNDGVYHAGGCEMLTQKVFVGITRNGVPYNTTLTTEETKDGTLLTTYQQDNDKRNVLEVESKSVEGSDTPEVIGLKWRNTDGDWIRYDPSNGGRVSAYGDRNNVQVSLQYDSTGRLSGLLDHNGKQVVWYDYDADGHVGAVRDYSGRKVEYHYTNGKLTGVVDVRGNTWVYGYNGKGLLSKKTDPNGHATTLEYATNGALTVFRDPSGAEKHYKYEFDKTKREFYKQEKSAAGVVTETWYDKDGAFLRNAIAGTVVKRIERDGNTETEYNEAGNATVMQYDSWHRLIKQTHPDGTSTSTTYYADTAWPTKHTDENSVVTKYEYDAHGNLTKLTEAVGLPEQRITDYTYDDYGNQLTKTVEADSVSVAVTEKYTYDAYGNVTSYTDGEGNTTSFTFDVMGNVKGITDKLKHAWTVDYDASGKPVTMTEPLGRSTYYEYDKVGNLIKETKPGNRITKYSYDVNDNLVSVTDALGAVTNFSYNADGRPASFTDATGITVSKLNYDNAGRLLKAVDSNSDTISLSYLNGAVNGAGDVASVQFPTYKTALSYDKLGRVAAMTDIGDSQTITTRYQYNTNDNSTVITDAKDRTSRYHYDGLGRKIEAIDPLTKSTYFAYDNRDNLLSVTNAKGGVTRRFEYDRSDRLTKEYRSDGSLFTYIYNDSNSTITRLDAKGQKTLYYHNEVGELSMVEYYKNNSTTDASKTVSLTYDEVGNLIGYNDGITSAQYSYDLLGRKTKETVHYGSFSLSYGYSYDAAGREVSFTGPDNSTVNYVYDNGGRPSTISLPGGGTVTYSSYNWLSPNRIILPGGGVESWDFDALMRPKEISAGDPAGKSLLDYKYTYDKAGNTLSKSTEHGNYSFSYDELDRLLGVDNPHLNDESYAYDAVGNRKKDAAVDGEWEYSSGDELISYSGVLLSYDDNGNLIEKNDSGNVTKYTYNIEGRLSEVRDGSGVLIASYYYDPFGRRLWKEVGGVRTYFLYTKEGVIAEADASGNLVRQYGWQPDGVWGINPLYLKTGGHTYYYINDQIGTPQKLVSTSGVVVWSAQYEGYGNAFPDIEQVANPLRFPGQYYDAETGLHYNYFRYYDPATGRYISPDPIGLWGGVNAYAYVYNNPVNLIDPYGLWSLGDPLPQGLVDFSAGFGDTLSFGFTDWVRDKMGTNGVVNKCSGAYGNGEIAGVAVGFAAGGAAGWRMAGEKAAGKEFSHWIPARAKKWNIKGWKPFNNRFGKWLLKNGNKWNGNYVSNWRHYKHDPFRYSRRKGDWKNWGSKWPKIIQQFDRIPNVYKGAGVGGAATGAKAAQNNCGCG